MVVISSTIAVGPIGQTLSDEGEPTGESGKALEQAFPRFALLPTISCGGWKQRKRSASARRRRIDRESNRQA